MPVILKGADYQTWLTGSAKEAKTLLKPFPAEEMEAFFVSTKVNRASHDGPELIERIGDPEEGRVRIRTVLCRCVGSRLLRTWETLH
jgi:hypothetical protein